MNESGDGGAASRELPYQRRIGLKSDVFPRWLAVYRDYIAPLIPGVAFSVTLAMAATSIGYGGPTVLFALLLGMAFNFLAVEPSFAAGLSLASRSILRVGVALLGARITSEQILALGWSALAGVTAAVAATILFGIFAARLTGMPQLFGVRRCYLWSLGRGGYCGCASPWRKPRAGHRFHHHWRDDADHGLHGPLSIAGAGLPFQSRGVWGVSRRHDS
jgi:hypothetical protein